jgi:two-component system, OmpR family, response regulator BaeR
MNQRHIVVVEDDAKIAAMIANYLQAQGHNVDVLANGLLAVDAIKRLPPDLVLLDLMLPGLDGLEVCRQVRSFSNVPIIMVTARIDEIDRLLGLEIGADDYVCKPFSPRELAARVKALLRRSDARGGLLAPTTQGFSIHEEAPCHSRPWSFVSSKHWPAAPALSSLAPNYWISCTKTSAM